MLLCEIFFIISSYKLSIFKDTVKIAEIWKQAHLRHMGKEKPSRCRMCLSEIMTEDRSPFTVLLSVPLKGSIPWKSFCVQKYEV